MASVEMYALKVAASLAVGIASALWMLSPKSYRSWTACMSRLCTRLSTSTAYKRGRPISLARPVVPAARHDNRPELSSLSPPAGVNTVGGGKGSSFYSAMDMPQRGNTTGRRTGALTVL